MMRDQLLQLFAHLAAALFRRGAVDQHRQREVPAKPKAPPMARRLFDLPTRLRRQLEIDKGVKEKKSEDYRENGPQRPQSTKLALPENRYRRIAATVSTFTLASKASYFGGQ